VLDQRRGSARRERLLEQFGDDLAVADASVSPRLDQERLAKCLDTLSERERTVLVLSFYDEQPADAVGRSLGLSAGNVRVIRHRSIDKLRRCVDSGKRVA